MKQKYLVPGIIVLGILILSFGLLWLYGSFAQSTGNIICRGGTPDNWIEKEGSFCSSMFSGITLAIRCKNANEYIVRTGQKDPFGNDYDSCSSSISGYVGCSYTLAGGSEKVTVYQSSCPSGDSFPPPSPTHDIVCADPVGHTQSELQSCTVFSESQTVAIWCTYAGEVIRREGSKEVCIPSTQVKSTEKKCSFENVLSHKQIEIYAAECPSPTNITKYLCNKTTGTCEASDDPQATSQAQCSLTCKKEVPPEPDLQCSTDKGLCRKGKVQECLAVCPATWEFIPPAGYTGTTSRLLGEGYVTGVNAEGKYLEGESVTDVKREIVIETVTEVKKETIVIEKEILVEVTPVEVPQTADAAACESFKNNITTALQERFVVLDTFQKAGEEAVSATADVKRASQKNIKAGVKELRNINKKNTAGFQCSVEHLRSMAGAVKGLDDVVIVQARQNLAIMKKEEKVQPQYFGIRQDITAVENALKRIPDEKRVKMETQIQYFEQCKKDFEELVLGEGLILASEIQETAAQCKTAKTQIASLLKSKSSRSKVLKKETSVKKATLKKKSAKKSLKGKKLKKSKKAKKTKKTKKAKKAKSKKNKRRA